jgi:ABC-type dipeptide/oligopeptide/nickel transport system ATPase component
MTIRYTNVADVLPETKMRLYPTKVINIVGGPGCDKSLISSAIILYLHLRNKTVETIPDFAKSLVWQRNYEVLNNQYFIAQRQYEMLNLLDGQVQFLITECSLPQVLYYNESYTQNICDVDKTRAQILEWYHQHDNINIFVERGNKKYVHTGRFQNEEQAREVDQGLRELMEREKLDYTPLGPNVDTINAFVQTLLS